MGSLLRRLQPETKAHHNLQWQEKLSTAATIIVRLTDPGSPPAIFRISIAFAVGRQAQFPALSRRMTGRGPTPDTVDERSDASVRKPEPCRVHFQYCYYGLWILCLPQNFGGEKRYAFVNSCSGLEHGHSKTSFCGKDT